MSRRRQFARLLLGVFLVILGTMSVHGYLHSASRSQLHTHAAASSDCQSTANHCAACHLTLPSLFSQPCYTFISVARALPQLQIIGGIVSRPAPRYDELAPRGPPHLA